MAKAKTLKDLNDQISSVSSTMLEVRVGQTILGGYEAGIDELYRSQLRSKSCKVDTPSLQKMCDMFPDLRQKLIDLYNREMNSVKDFEKVPDDIKVAQGALIDGLCYVCDMTTGEVTLATMNFSVLCDLDIDFDLKKQIIKKNLEGFCKAYRIDVEYINGDKEFTFKAVNARNYDIDDIQKSDVGKHFVICPYVAGLRLIKMCEGLLNRGYILRIRQTNEGVVKVRYLTTDVGTLQKYCDDPNAVTSLQSCYFPLRSFFYAPVIGAPSTTAMVSRVNIFDIYSIQGAMPGKVDLVKAGITKPETPVKDLIGERYFISEMMKIKGRSMDEFCDLLKKLSYQGKLLKNPEAIDKSELSTYLHGVTPAAVKKAYRLTGVDGKIEQAMRFMSNGTRAMTPEELSNIEETLKNNICKFIIRKNDCTLSSIFGTNDSHQLAGIYGKDYFGIYEGFGARFGKFSRELKNFFEYAHSDTDVSVGSEVWQDLTEEAELYGMPNDDDAYSKILELAQEYDDSDAFLRHTKAYLAEKCGVNLKRSEAASKSAQENKDNGTFMCRSLTAYVDENGKVYEYYKNLDRSKIVSAMIFE